MLGGKTPVTLSRRWTPLFSLCLVLLLLLTLVAVQDTEAARRKNKRRRSNRCEDIEVPMCKGLISYNATRLPNKFGHRTQTEVYWALQPWWPFIDAGCSNNLREFLCGLYLPRCSGDGRDPQYPCMETCRKAKVRCSKQMRRERMRWAPQFQCSRLLPKSSRRCIKPQRERKKNKIRQYIICDNNRLSMCQGIPFGQGSLPNMFLQNNVAEIDQEMRQFQFLVDSGCSKKLRLFMCGAYMPFCVTGTVEEERESASLDDGGNSFPMVRQQTDVPFVVPCRELCQEVYDQCSGEYQQRTNGLPWPAKFHCHRYPSYIDRYDSNHFGGADDTSSSSGGGRFRRRGRVSTTVPCTMPPYNYDGN